MLIKAGFEIAFELWQPTPLMCMLSVHPDREGDLLSPDVLTASGGVAPAAYIDSFGNRCHAMTAQPGLLTLTSDFTIRDSGLHDRQSPGARQLELAELPFECLQFLLGSRYCETDRLMPIAWGLFGGIEPGWTRVQAIVDFVHNQIAFGYHNARNTRTALEAYEERVGVCRDFAHLAVALCRCMNIPARYCTGYLGDIGVPADPAPMDFSAWFEAYLEGGWHTFDARHREPRIGRVVMARGRDATDVALTNIFGPNRLATFRVWTDEVAEPAVDAGSVARLSGQRLAAQAA